MTYIPVEINITEVDPIVIEVQPEAVAQTAANLAIEAKTAIQAMLVTLQPLIDELNTLLAVGGKLDEIEAIEAKLTELTAIYNKLTVLQALYDDLAEFNALYAALAQLLAVHAALNSIATVEAALTSIAALEAKLTELQAVYAKLAEIETVADNIVALAAIHTELAKLTELHSNLAKLTTVYNNLSAIGEVADSIANLNQLAASLTNLNTLAASLTNLNALAGSLDELNTLHSNLSALLTVEDNLAAINAVNAALASIATAATNIAAINTAATNIDDIIAAPTHAATATDAAAAAVVTKGEVEDLKEDTTAEKLLAIAAKQGAETAETNAETAYANTQTLLTNFFDPSVMALNARGVAEGATFVEKLRYVQAWLDELATAGVEPSLAYMPAVDKIGKLYSVLPADGSGDFTVTRAGTTAFTQTPDSYWKPAAANEPRFTYTNGVRGLLVEGAATRLNADPYSVEKASWTKSGVRVEGDPATAGSDILAGWDFMNWQIQAGLSSVINSNTFECLTATAAGIFKNILVIGKFYRLTISGNTTSSQLRITNVGQDKFVSGTFSIEIYGLASSTSLYLRNSSAGVTTITSFTLKEVSGFDCPFVDANGINTKQGRKLVEDSSNGNHYITNTPPLSITTGTIISVSAIAKYTGRHLYLYDNAAVAVNASFNLQNGTLIFKAANVISTTIKEENDGYYKVTITYAVQNNLATLRLYTHNGSTTSYQGDGVSGVIVSGFFVESGTVATSPIGGAEGATQTRNADVETVNVPAGVTQIILTNMNDVETIVTSFSSPYQIPVGTWKSITMK